MYVWGSDVIHVCMVVSMLMSQCSHTYVHVKVHVALKYQIIWCVEFNVGFMLHFSTDKTRWMESIQRPQNEGEEEKIYQHWGKWWMLHHHHGGVGEGTLLPPSYAWH